MNRTHLFNNIHLKVKCHPTKAVAIYQFMLVHCDMIWLLLVRDKDGHSLCAHLFYWSTVRNVEKMHLKSKMQAWNYCIFTFIVS